MTRLLPAYPVSLAALIRSFTPAVLPGAARPNILFIMSDDHSCRAMGCHGSRLAKLNPTPNLDRFAESATMRISRATIRLLAVVAGLLAGSGVSAAGGGAEPTWESLQHNPPEWLLDAKLGIYTHWGPYSVPAYHGEWYPKRMYEERGDVARHHAQTWGGPGEFPYHKFVPMFKAEKYDPAGWAKLMKATGAKYAGMAVVHHDGFLLWDSKINRWNAKQMGPKRDCYGEYVQALRAEGLKTIATFHHIRTFNWFLPGAGGLGGEIPAEKAEEIRAKGWALTDPQFNDMYWNELAGGKYEDFLDEWQAEGKLQLD